MNFSTPGASSESPAEWSQPPPPAYQAPPYEMAPYPSNSGEVSKGPPSDAAQAAHGSYHQAQHSPGPAAGGPDYSTGDTPSLQSHLPYGQLQYPPAAGSPGYSSGSPAVGYPTGSGAPGYPPGSGTPGYPPGPGAPPYPPTGAPAYPTLTTVTTVHTTNPALLGVHQSPDHNGNLWVPETVPFSDFAAYLPYYELPIPKPPLINKKSKNASFIMLGFGLLVSVGLVIAGVMSDPIGYETIGAGGGFFVICLVMSLHTLYRRRKIQKIYDARVDIEKRSVECIRAGKMPPLPRVPVCKFCRMTWPNRWTLVLLCERPPHIAVPPVLACIGNLGTQYQDVVENQLQALYK
ncbi:hypothetical protein, variant [Fonticula alba]|uniref:Uncharacterized protein n=1 Tax=Fonticula alba TaxID=691883 RepID=A0A058Z995_FONAL|nr:hypothetical protein H696_03206 [Fonticula alba]XP_009495366.1 hypothetical protein, variant [Fonticula alba]KCV70849.1 hypothetical protein H696_03206 [Fonticula alba]KCV70850.1 hypothetical protein, variant [Fonticula alba]|eukprot:XP_009495365.1 hypothetical protein H696_03206 [Fonticula alba]